MKKKLHYFIFIFILNGCVEHFFYIDIKPDSDYNINYKKEHIIKNKFFSVENSSYKNKYIFDILELNDHYEKLLKQPIVLNNKNYFFFEITRLKIIFKKRNITKQYPILYNLSNVFIRSLELF